MCYLWLSHDAPKLTQNKIFEYAHQILCGNDIEPSNSKNNNYIQITTGFAYVCI